MAQKMLRTSVLNKACVLLTLYIYDVLIILRVERAAMSQSIFFVVRTSPTYLFTVGVEVVDFHLVTLRHTPHLVGLLWTRDRPVAETST
jgi:hypothetical protein